ncbi:glyoxalase/bleomycin resistance/extradiol dioxygenase family protein [Tabrizicola sp.]|uniref:VOC family protein n=1 Tax=Tabrizicola sp. TaxID=2005166 RepID=UPI00286D2CF7|nr:glyoxalase/bleomycin resistance/extradiol dioxygenase family protein [Tabrizicola sp.]
MPTEMEVQTNPDDRVMKGVIPYLVIPGKAGAATDFYIKAFAASDLGRMPMEDTDDQFMHIQVEINGGALMLTDYADVGVNNQGEGPMPRGHLQLVLADGQAWWDRAVAAGCTVIAPYERQFWGDNWGLLLDPFGIRWAIMQPGPQG